MMGGAQGIPQALAPVVLLSFCVIAPSWAFVRPVPARCTLSSSLSGHTIIASATHVPGSTLACSTPTAASYSQKRAVIKFITSNPLKTREVQALLAEGGLRVPFDIQTLDIQLPELQESPLVIAIEKTRLASNRVKAPCLVEDTSLCLNALGGLPGPYIKHFLDELGSAGLFKMVEAYEDRSARAICNVGFSPGPGQQPVIFTGITYGEIVLPEEDDNGFGWDTCFRPSGFTTTFSKMTVNEKNAISHRSLALRQFQQYIADNWGEGGFDERGVFK